MRRAAKVFMNNRSQAVRLQKEFQFTTREVFIRKEGGDVILSPGLQIGPPTLTRRLKRVHETVEDLPVQERER